MTSYRENYRQEETAPLEPEDRQRQLKPLALNEHFAEADTKDALRVLILQRFTGWLDHVLAEEKPLEGVAAELLAEFYDDQASNTAGPGTGADDLHSTWSAMTALTQEIKLQGRAFKQLSEKVAPLAGLNATIENLLATQQEALSDARRIAEAGRADRTERETAMKRAARQQTRREFIAVIIDIRDSLVIGMRSADESQRKLKDSLKRSRLKKIFRSNRADHDQTHEIVRSLIKGYQMGLDRIDEALGRLGVIEMKCEGQPFDPRIMNAADIVETDQEPDGTVIEVYRTGYMLDSEVLQPAQVKVARATEQH